MIAYEGKSAINVIRLRTGQNWGGKQPRTESPIN